MVKRFGGLLAAMGLVVSAACGDSVSQARGVLLCGVRSIDSGGAPGVVLCGGENAFPLVGAACNKAVLPVAAAAFYGEGRVVALGHPSFCSSEGLGKSDTSTFVTNALVWLGRGARPVSVYKNPDFAKALRGLGWEVREIPSLDALEPHGVLAAYPDGLPAGDIARTRHFITSGGGLLATGIGWGWLQVNGGKSLSADSQFNRLLAPAGLMISGDFAERTDKGGYLADGKLPAGVSVTEAAALAAGGTVSDPALLRQIGVSLCAAKACMPPGDYAIAKAVDALMRSPQAAMLPSPAAPLKAGDIPARLTLLAQQSAWLARSFDAWPAHPDASVYPGLPPAGAPRGARTLTVDLGVPRWHGTGLYACAGEPVTVELPAGAEKLKLRLRIGATTCDNTRHDHWERAPKVDEEVPLTNPTTAVSSPFGGMLYIVVPDPVAAGADARIRVTLRNACRAAWFKAGRDTAEAWRTAIRSAPAPWAELESRKIVLTVPADAVRTLDDPDALLAFWERVENADARLTAIDPEGRRYAERYSADVQLCAGWMHAGYPIMIPVVTAKDAVSLKTLETKGDWGLFHEMGHNHQNADWTFEGTGEVTVNFFTLYDLDRICGIPPRKTRMGEAGIQKQVRAWAAKGKPHDEWCREPFLALEMFVRLQQAYGWPAFEKLFAEYRRLGKEERPKNDGEKRDQWVLRLSRLTGQNIAAVFDAWSVPISDAARQDCARYPRPSDARLFDGVL